MTLFTNGYIYAPKGTTPSPIDTCVLLNKAGWILGLTNSLIMIVLGSEIEQSPIMVKFIRALFFATILTGLMASITLLGNRNNLKKSGKPHPLDSYAKMAVLSLISFIVGVFLIYTNPDANEDDTAVLLSAVTFSIAALVSGRSSASLIVMHDSECFKDSLKEPKRVSFNLTQ